jgi:guanylate kinase
VSTLIIVSSPSGAGKDTLIRELLKQHPMYFSLSCTTRASRPGDERAVKKYLHIDIEEFQQNIERGYFAEWAQYSGRYYGTPRSELTRGGEILVEIEIRGAMQIKSQFPHAHSIFVLPPPPEELERRITGRGSGETPEILQSRIQEAGREVARAGQCDFWFQNDKLDVAVSQLCDLVSSLCAGHTPSAQYRDLELLSRVQALFT